MIQKAIISKCTESLWETPKKPKLEAMRCVFHVRYFKGLNLKAILYDP